MNGHPQKTSYASRGGDKLVAALDKSGVSVQGFTVADFGSSTGGFVDVLLQRGASRVYAVEIGVGLLDWGLRNDPRVTVMERTDVRTVTLPELVDLITADAGFTRHVDFIPHALTMIKSNGLIISLIKPQYEVSGRELVRGRLTQDLTDRIVNRVVDQTRHLGATVIEVFPSAVKGKDAKVQEFFMIIRPS
jgi:23S rRNA (cytidine1920-2'-O)/16S rRNA (cytidine1409-2'-O)-methyltransferase